MTTRNYNTRNQGHWVLLMLISTAYIAVFANIQGFKAMLPLVQDEFLLSRTQVGLYSSFYFLSAVFIAVFSGKIADRLGTKKGLVLGVGVVAVMIVLHALSPFFGLILFFSFITGTAFSLITPSVNKGIFELSDPSKRSFSMGLVHGGGGLGGVLGEVMLPYLGELYGWRTALLMGSILAFTVTLLIARFYNPPAINDDEENSKSGKKENSSLKADLLGLLGNRYLVSVFLMGIVFGMSISSVTGHFALFLTRDLGMTTTLAGIGLGAFHVGGVLGQPFWGMINEAFFHGDRRRGLFLLGLLIAIMALFMGLVINRFNFSTYAVLFFSFLFGFCTMGVITIYFTAVSEAVPLGFTGIATGLALMFPRASTVFTPPLFGIIADTTGDYSLSWVILGVIVFFCSISFYIWSGRHLKAKDQSQ